jgi:hypothetical protein
MRPILFLLLGLLAGLMGCDSGSYRKKSAGWVYDDTAFTPADPKTFKPIDSLFARDAVRGYYRGSAVSGSEGATFEVMSEHEARDAHAVYYCDTYRKAQEYWAFQHLRVNSIPGADPASYVVLGARYARDRHRVYLEGVPYTVRDPSSFEPMEAGFTRDAQRGYYQMVEIAGSDGASLRAIDPDDPSYVRDRTTAYHGHVEVNTPNRGPYPVVRKLAQANLATLRVLGRGYATDGSRVWHEGVVLPHADAGTFVLSDEPGSDADAHDRTQSWSMGKRVKASLEPAAK